jgi:hypothetical protein
MKPHYYRTANINWGAREILLPVNQFAHRTWAFTEKSWGEYFTDIFNDWKYMTFKEYIKKNRIDLDLPLYQDGLDLWDTIHEYVKSYISLDEIILDHPETVSFWNNLKYY